MPLHLHPTHIIPQPNQARYHLNTATSFIPHPLHSTPHPPQQQQRALVDHMTTDIQNLKSFDPFAEADDTGGETKTSQQNYIHIRIQRKSLRSRRVLHARAPTCAARGARISRTADVNPAQSAMVAKP